ncbi:beta-ketoacyl synthase N-terminal-like domain-containing protein [Actinomadura roseirufa]|uniref:beta-ketoacyl synthase N-terminal-like domain-containing protein n=1 Tax=Actinomadura roseirufa TaxID=2094049 RepID=UPI001A955F34|nr:beta-ketoacyl synthase N-terminal-like domain-containing protein [Actinomadura roseirufa]
MTVCVTGMAWTTALGTDMTRVWSRLLNGESGITEVRTEHRLRNALAAPVAAPGGTRSPAARQRAIAADTIGRARADAGLVPGSPDEEPCLVIGTSFGAHLDGEDAPLDRWAGEVARGLGMSRPPVVVSTACSSGSDAIAAGTALLGSGAADACLCAGVDVLTPAKRLGHSALGTMSPTRLRAFDRRADGTLLGEGGGCLVLETAESARRRGVTPYAVVHGAGAANDGAGMTVPDPSGEGVLRAVRAALAGTGFGLPDVAVVNAHGTGTPANDAVETASLARLFAGADRPVVFATKGAFGHSLGATGAVEAIAVILALRHGWAPPVAGLRDVVEGFGPPIPAGRAAPVDKGVGLSLTLGFGGFITCLAFGV